MGVGNAHLPARAGFLDDVYMLANETADSTKNKDLVSLIMAAPIRCVTDMCDNPKTISGVYIYYYNHNPYYNLRYNPSAPFIRSRFLVSYRIRSAMNKTYYIHPGLCNPYQVLLQDTSNLLRIERKK